MITPLKPPTTFTHMNHPIIELSGTIPTACPFPRKTHRKPKFLGSVCQGALPKAFLFFPIAVFDTAFV